MISRLKAFLPTKIVTNYYSSKKLSPYLTLLFNFMVRISGLSKKVRTFAVDMRNRWRSMWPVEVASV